jgi:hypothetical protein
MINFSALYYLGTVASVAVFIIVVVISMLDSSTKERET